jgi:hypothetical protein
MSSFETPKKGKPAQTFTFETPKVQPSFSFGSQAFGAPRAAPAVSLPVPRYATPSPAAPVAPAPSQPQPYGTARMGIAKQSFAPRPLAVAEGLRHNRLPNNLMETRVLGAFNSTIGKGWVKQNGQMKRYGGKKSRRARGKTRRYSRRR